MGSGECRGTTVAVINRVPGIVESLGLPERVVFVEPAEADLVFLFVHSRAELNARMPPAVAALKPASAIWVFFREGSGGAGLDMNRDIVWAVADKLEMGPLGLISVNETWSAFRLKRAGVRVPRKVGAWPPANGSPWLTRAPPLTLRRITAIRSSRELGLQSTPLHAPPIPG